MSFIRGDATYADYVGPSGRVYPLTGPRRGSMGIQMGRDAEGLLGPSGGLLTDSAARQHGIDIAGVSIGAAYYEYNFDVWGKTAREWAVVNRMWLDDWDFLRPGFLRYYTSDFGWRWTQVQQGRDHAGAYKIDPRRTRQATYAQVAVAPSAYWRAKDVEDSWIDKGTHIVHMKLWNGGDVPAWPQLTLTGNCGFRIRWRSNDFEVPKLLPGEDAVVSSLQTDQSIRTINADGTRGRNLLPLTKGRYFKDPIESGVVETVIIETLGGAGKVQARVPQQFKRPI